MQGIDMPCMYMHSISMPCMYVGHNITFSDKSSVRHARKFAGLLEMGMGAGGLAPGKKIAVGG